MRHDTIAVIDFGGQYAHLIANKVRRQGVLAEIRQPEDRIDEFRQYRGIIISGSPSMSSRDEDAGYTKEIFDLDVPILGFCFGHQEIAKRYGGTVVAGGRQWGRAELHLTGEHRLFSGLGPVEQVFMSHYDSVASIGPEFEEYGYTPEIEGAQEHRYAAIGSDSLRRYGFQYHPEVDDTLNGDRMIGNFVLDICGCTPSWDMQTFFREEKERVVKQVGGESVFLLASGGVDSTVAAVLLGQALGPDKVHLLHIDNGMMRKDESKKVLAMFEKLGLGSHLHFVDATDTFLSALEGVIEPERKRGIIGNTFIDVFNAEASRLNIEDHLLAQGTIYPDTIETGGTKRAHTIKTHHNRVAVIEKLIQQGKVVEPLADLYKVEVRELGEHMQIPREILDRHPFPGPGLGVRVLCSDGIPDSTGFDEVVSQLDKLGDDFGLNVLPLPIKSVGVKADLRAYEHPVLLSGEAPWENIINAVSLITSEVPGFNRCIWNLSETIPEVAKPVAATITKKRLDLLREADHLVMEGLYRHGLYETIWQCPTILVPISFDDLQGELIVVRPIKSERAMTATPVELPDGLIAELRESILALDGVSALALDVTSKPPGTIEWE